MDHIARLHNTFITIDVLGHFVNSSHDLQADLQCLFDQLNRLNMQDPAALKTIFSTSGLCQRAPVADLYAGSARFLGCLNSLFQSAPDSYNQLFHHFNQALPHFLMGMLVGARTLSGKGTPLPLTPGINDAMAALNWPDEWPGLYDIATNPLIPPTTLNAMIEALQAYHVTQEALHAENRVFHTIGMNLQPFYTSTFAVHNEGTQEETVLPLQWKWAFTPH